MCVVSPEVIFDKMKYSTDFCHKHNENFCFYFFLSYQIQFKESYTNHELVKLKLRWNKISKKCHNELFVVAFA